MFWGKMKIFFEIKEVVVLEDFCDRVVLKTDNKSTNWPYDENLKLTFSCAKNTAKIYLVEELGVKEELISIIKCRT